MTKLWKCELQKLFRERAFVLLVGFLVLFQVLFLGFRLWKPDSKGNTVMDLHRAYQMRKTDAERVQILRCLEYLSRTEYLEFMPGQMKEGMLERAREEAGLSEAEVQALRREDWTTITGDVARELALWQAVERQSTDAAGYPEYLDRIRRSGENLKKSPLFQADGYSLVLAEKSSQAYDNISGDRLPMASPLGIQLALGGWEDKAACCVCSVLLCVFLFLKEKDSGMIALIFSTQNGKSITWKTKTKILLAGTGIYTMMGAVVRTLVAAVTVGLGDLSRPAQTIPEFYRSPFSISCGALLWMAPLLELLAVWLVSGLAMWFCVVFRKALALAGMAVTALVSVGMDRMIEESSLLQPLKYLNLCSLFRTDRLLGDAIYLRIGNLPLPCLWVSVPAALIVGAAALWLARGTYGMWSRQTERGTAKKSHGTKKKSAGLFWLELKKLLFPVGGFGILALTLAIQPVFYQMFQKNQGIQEERYRIEMEQIQGSFSDTIHQQILETCSSLEEEREALLETDAPLSRVSEVERRLECMQRIKAQSMYLSEQESSVSYVYLTGWEMLSGSRSFGPEYAPYAVLLGMVLLLPGIFTLEKETQMDGLCRTTGGEKKQKKVKWTLLFLTSAVLFLINGMPGWIYVLRNFRLQLPFAAAASVPCLNFFPDWFCVLGAVIALWGIRLAGTLICAFLIGFLSERCKTYFAAVGICGGVMVVLGGVFWII